MLTDWGAHHVDIAQWALGMDDTSPTLIDAQGKLPAIENGYNTATEFQIAAVYGDDTKMTIRHDLDNGILFEGTEGRIFINRGQLRGKPVEELASQPLPDGAVEEVYKNRPLTDHFRNFFEAVIARKEPVSDVFSHHRALTTCHLAGIAARLGRKIQWDPKKERVVDDALAQSLVAREKRQAFAIEM